MSNKRKVADYDVVVVGAGNAALVAALSARAAGAKVLVLEVAPKEQRGGNSYFTGGGFRVPLKGLAEVRELSAELTDAEAAVMDMTPYTGDQFRNVWMRLSDRLVDQDLMETVIQHGNSTIHWMKDQGIIWEPYEARAIKINNRLVWQPNTILLVAKGAGAGLSDMLFELVEKKGCHLKYETRAARLIIDKKGAVCGVTVKDAKGFHDIRSNAVFLACGGFESNREMRAKYLGAKWEMAKNRGTRYNMGAGLKMALEIGAQPAGQWSKCHGTVIDADVPQFIDREIGDQTSRGSYTFGIMVNMLGQRFADEGEDIRQFTYAKLGQAVLEQPRALAYQLFNSGTRNIFESRYEQTSVPKEANTIPELAAKLGIDAEALGQTVNRYNAAVQEGKFDPVVKDGKRTVGLYPPKSNWAQKLDSPPFLAYGVTGGITFSYGGLKINTKAQVLDCEDRVIPGLYAAGETVGGLFYNNYPGGTCLTAGAVFGRLGGALAAKEPQK